MQIIEIQDLAFSYENTTQSGEALRGVSLSFKQGEFVGLAGQTGSGKSTLVQLIAGLLPAPEGAIRVAGLDPSRREDLRALRRKVGMVFQYPEHQLFDETVLGDVSFGPRNLELSNPEKRAQRALELLGLDPAIAGRSPFALSGGQRRRVAIAGVLAMEPEILILDEPTAGLDPEGRNTLLSVVERLHKEEGRTIILISHRMEELAPRVNRMVVLNEGRVLLDGTPQQVFSQQKKLQEASLAAPPVTAVLQQLRAKGWPVRLDLFTVSQARDEITNAWRQKC